jgi:hypothetical protein
MGRRWWQREARRAQNEQAPVAPSREENVVIVSTETVPVAADAVEAAEQAPIEAVADVASDDHIDAAGDVSAELAETISMIEAEDVDQVTLSPEQAAIEDAKDAATAVPVVVTQNKHVIDNKKKRR